MDDPQIAAWKVPLVGHQFDLEDLPLWLVGQEVRVEPYDNGFALVIPVSVIGNSHEPVRAFAEEQLELLNGVGRLLSSGFRPVSIADRLVGVDAAGAVRNTVLAVTPAEMRANAGSIRAAIGGKVQPDPAEGAASPLLRAASRSPRAHDGLVIVGRPHLTWSELYLLFELVEGDVGRRMVDLGWIKSGDAELFTHTANSYTALRTDGRHGKDRGFPPAQPMQHATALTLIRALVLAWLSYVGR
jgi:hypothetical protein